MSIKKLGKKNFNKTLKEWWKASDILKKMDKNGLKKIKGILDFVKSMLSKNIKKKDTDIVGVILEIKKQIDKEGGIDKIIKSIPSGDNKKNLIDYYNEIKTHHKKYNKDKNIIYNGYHKGGNGDSDDCCVLCGFFSLILFGVFTLKLAIICSRGPDMCSELGGGNLNKKIQEGGYRWNYIVNPQTNRKVSIHGSLGKKILKKYVKLFQSV